MNAARQWLLLIACLASTGQAAVAQTCPFKPWMNFRGVSLQRTADGTAYAYKTSEVAIDADGAPGAYCPGDKGLDRLANAGYPDKDWPSVLVRDPKDPGKPLVATAGPGKGCYVSMTSLRASGGQYVDALSVPYMVFPSGFGALNGTGYVGDVALMQSNDGMHISPAIVADTGGGGDAKLGEISIALAQALGATVASPRDGQKGMALPITAVVFRHSFFEPLWPVSNADIGKRAQQHLDQLGGWAAVKACSL